MGNIFNDDFRDFLNALNTQEVRYVLVGGFSVMLQADQKTLMTWKISDNW